MLKFKEYLKLINENTSNTKIKDFSFSTWLLEAAMSPATRYAARAKVKALGDSKVLEKAELIMELVKQKLFTHWPMWRPFWSKMPPIASFGAGSKDEDGFGTMCTTGTAIFYCPRFVLEQYEIAKTTFASQFPGGNIPNANSAIRTGLRHPLDYSLFVIIHEILHCSLKHHLRMPRVESKLISQDEIAYWWNIAADYEINHLLLKDVKSDYYEMVPGGVRADADGGVFAVPEKDLAFFSESQAESIFWRIIRNLEDERQNDSGDEEDQDGDQEGQDGDQGGDQEGQDGDQDGDQEGQDGDQEGQDGDDRPLQNGDVIYDRPSGEYGIISNIDGDNVQFDPISEEEARKRLKK